LIIHKAYKGRNAVCLLRRAAFRLVVVASVVAVVDAANLLTFLVRHGREVTIANTVVRVVAAQDVAGGDEDAEDGEDDDRDDDSNRRDDVRRSFQLARTFQISRRLVARYHCMRT